MTTIHFIILCFPELRLRFGNGSLSSSVLADSWGPPLQLPLDALLQTDLTTRKACIFLENSATFGLSCTEPRCLCKPKNHSSGSWHNRWLKRDCTSGMEKRNGTKSKNDSARSLDKNKLFTHKSFRVASLRSILFL